MDVDRTKRAYGAFNEKNELIAVSLNKQDLQKFKDVREVDVKYY